MRIVWFRRCAGWGKAGLGAGCDAIEGRPRAWRCDFATGRVDRSGGKGRGERPCPAGIGGCWGRDQGRGRGQGRRRRRRGGQGKGKRYDAMPIAGMTRCMMQCDLAFRLTLILEPNRDGFHFPIIQSARASVAPVTRGGMNYVDVHACSSCDRLALFARWMGCLVKELLEHHQLDTGKTFACSTCGIIRRYTGYRGCPGKRGQLHRGGGGEGQVDATRI